MMLWLWRGEGGGGGEMEAEAAMEGWVRGRVGGEGGLGWVCVCGVGG